MRNISSLAEYVSASQVGLSSWSYLVDTHLGAHSNVENNLTIVRLQLLMSSMRPQF